jgi:hypothetical protein
MRHRRAARSSALRRARESLFTVRTLTITSLAFGLFAATPASANPIWCQGTVTSVYVSDAGDVIFQPSYRVDYTQVCNLHGTWKGVSSETCFSWYSAIMAAKVHNRQVLLQYATDSYTCANLPTYAGTLRPNYVMVIG